MFGTNELLAEEPSEPPSLGAGRLQKVQNSSLVEATDTGEYAPELVWDKGPYFPPGYWGTFDAGQITSTEMAGLDSYHRRRREVGESVDAALEFSRRATPGHLRADGSPDRPLTSYSVEFVA